jgi:hypothetical protein
MNPETLPNQPQSTDISPVPQKDTSMYKSFLRAAALLVVGFGVGLAASQVVLIEEKITISTEQNKTTPAASIETFEDKTPSDWKEYSEVPGIKFYYPSNWTRVSQPGIKPEIISHVSFVMNPPGHVYTGTSTEPYNRGVSLAVYPLDNFKAIQDESSFFVYDNTKKEMLHVMYKDCGSDRVCEATDWATTTLSKNVKIGGKEGYLFLDSSIYFIPINETIGASISVNPYAEDLDEISRQLLGSFRFN